MAELFNALNDIPSQDTSPLSLGGQIGGQKLPFGFVDPIKTPFVLNDLAPLSIKTQLNLELSNKKPIAETSFSTLIDSLEDDEQVFQTIAPQLQLKDKKLTSLVDDSLISNLSFAKNTLSEAVKYTTTDLIVETIDAVSPVLSEDSVKNTQGETENLAIKEPLIGNQDPKVLGINPDFIKTTIIENMESLIELEGQDVVADLIDTKPAQLKVTVNETEAPIVSSDVNHIIDIAAIKASLTDVQADPLSFSEVEKGDIKEPMPINSVINVDDGLDEELDEELYYEATGKISSSLDTDLVFNLKEKSFGDETAINDFVKDQKNNLEEDVPEVVLLQPSIIEKTNFVLADKEPRIAVSLSKSVPVSQTATTNNQQTSTSINLGQNVVFKDSGQGQGSGSNSGQSQQDFQSMNQLFTKLKAAENQQANLSTFKSLLTEAEKPDRILGDLGVGLSRRSEMPLAMQSIGANVRSPQWGQEVGKRLIYMANKSIQEAKINLSPEKLGPIQIKISLDKDQQLNISMVAQHGTTREMLENALPRLREMLESANVNLVNVDIGKGKDFEQENNASDNKNSTNNRMDLSSEDEELESKIIRSSDNLIDYYA